MHAAANASPGPIHADLPCISCGYNVAGLPIHGACPECARPIADSIRGDLLRYATPAFVRRLERGALLAAVGVLAPIAFAAGRFAIGGARTFAAQAACSASVLALGGCWVAGWWLLTVRRPDGLRTDGEPSRLTARAAIAVQGAMIAVLAGFELFAQRVPAGPEAGIVVAAAIASAAALGAGGMLHVARLALRTSAGARYAARARGLAVAIPVAAALIGGVVLFRFMFRRAPLPPALGLILASLGPMLTLLCWGLAADTLWRLRGAIREERLAFVPPKPQA